MSCGHSGNTHPSFEKGLLQRKELKGCGRPPCRFSSSHPHPHQGHRHQGGISEQDPRHTYTGSGEQSLLRPLGWDPPPLQPGGLDWRRLRDYHPHLGALLAWDVCSSGASSLAAFPEIQCSFLLGPAHSWPQKAGFSNQPWEKRSAFIIAPSE